MNELHLHRLATVPERDRRTTEETSARMFAAVVRGLRRLRRGRTRAVVLQPGTSTR